MMRMSPILLVGILFVRTILAAPVPACTADSACKLHVGWEPYAPYTFADKRGEVTGADIELIRTLAGEVGCALEFAELPWARILREIELGTLDVSTSTSWTVERTAWAWFSEPYRETEMAIYVRRDEVERFELKSLADIAPQRFRLGVITDYYYGDEYRSLAEDPRYAPWIDGATDYATSIRKLTSGRIDGYLVEDVQVMEAELARLGLTDSVARYPLPIKGEQLRFMFSRKTVDQEIVAAINAALERMRADGRLADITSKYLP
jgi:polar amino acid transport system substrate-binding protein